MTRVYLKMLFRFEKQLEEEDPFLPSPQTNRFFSYKFRFLLPSPPPPARPSRTLTQGGHCISHLGTLLKMPFLGPTC